MGVVRRVTAADDEVLRDYVGLTDMALRTRREPAEGLFIAEGDKVIRRALDAGYAMRSLLLEEKWLPAMARGEGRPAEAGGNRRSGLVRDAAVTIATRFGLATLIFLIFATVLAYMAYQNVWHGGAGRRVRATGPLDPENMARRDAASREAGVEG